MEISMFYAPQAPRSTRGSNRSSLSHVDNAANLRLQLLAEAEQSAAINEVIPPMLDLVDSQYVQARVRFCKYQALMMSPLSCEYN